MRHGPHGATLLLRLPIMPRQALPQGKYPCLTTAVFDICGNVGKVRIHRPMACDKIDRTIKRYPTPAFAADRNRNQRATGA